ncbi:choice-of-anchor D domain-containing protein [Lutibacter sp.]|uniref:choice-of-anchor D domain-containing protein n=1 Tax=Lutibacter sp. TaxID=1925666 RepID=UPI0025C1CA6E|nr:choice-of-anchor D domain-containing protein [Lutibacter sp.]MCF6180613.1 choice-of-anchor D domain-containing protein [Lutibacter sp.]
MYFKPQLLKKILFSILFFIAINSFSQVTIWSEDFTTYANGSTTGVGNKWTTTTTSGIRYFEVRNNEFDARDTNASEQIFATEVIDISAYSNINLSVDVFRVGGVMEPSDYVNVYYKLDGGGEILFTTNGANSDDFPSRTASQSGLNGSTLQIIIRVKNGTGNAEIYGFDNILVQGTSGTAEINIQGNATDIPDGNTVISSTDDTYFGNVDISSGNTAHTFTIQNIGTASLSLTGANPYVVITGDVTEFSLTSTPSATIGASSSTTFNITFNPTSLGSKTATISIANSDSNENPYTFSINGVGISTTPEINVVGNNTTIVDGNTTISTTDDTNFGNVNISSAVLAHTFTIQNLGGIDLVLTNPSPYITISGATTEFTLTANPITPIGSTSSTTFTITFNPTSTGTKTATISIANNDSNENPYTFDIQGVGIIPTYCFSNGDSTAGEYIGRVQLNTIDNSSGAGTTSTGYSDFTAISTNLILNTTHTVTVTKTWTSWSYSEGVSVWIDWNQDGDFSDTGEQVLSSAASTTSSVFNSFTVPSSATLGTTRMRVSMSYDAIPSSCGSFSYGEVEDYTINVTSSSVVEIDVLGNLNSIADGDTTPINSDETDFGTVNAGSTLDHTFTIDNLGNSSTTLNLSGSPIVAISGNATFTVLTQPSSTSIIGGNSLTFVVRFAPTVNGTVTANISIANNDSNENPYNFTIQGTGSAPLTIGPGGVTSDLKLWLKSTSGLGYTNGQAVSLWADQGRGSNATVHTAGQEPTYRDDAAYNVNFNPVVDFDNSAPYSKDVSFTYNNTSTQFLEGVSGYYTQDVFIVLIPDVTVDSTFGFMDVFCGDELPGTDQTDGTGTGLGYYTDRFSGEIISYAVGTTSNGDGYGVAEIGTGNTYNNVGIINPRNNTFGTQQELYYNATNIETTQNDIADFSNVNNSRYWIGRSEGWEASTDARIAEIITYSTRKGDASLTDERNKIQSYLAIKYGITLGSNGTSQDYVDSDGTVIWDQSVNSGFNYDIAGIGRDDASALNQKQSKSVNSDFDGTGQIRGLVTMGLTDIYNTNNENINTNSTTLNDKQFLTWGNNNGNLNFAPNVVSVNLSDGIAGLSTPVSFIGMSRVWKVVEHGGDIPSVKVSIPIAAVRNIYPPGSYLMFISSSGTFDPTSDYRVMSNNGTDISTDYDFNGTKYITFGYAPEYRKPRSINFDGVQDFIEADNTLDLNPSSFTISAWIKREAGSTNTTILSKRDDNPFTTGYDFKINASNKFEVVWKNGTTNTITSNTTIPQDEWHQVAITYTNGTAKLYIDGVLDITDNSLSNPTNNSQTFLIAASDKSAPTAFFNGNIDEIRVWNTELTIDQLHYIMNQEIEDISNFTDGSIIPETVTKNEVSTIPWSDLEVYYPMSGYAYTNINDDSGNYHSGAIRNLDTVDWQTAPLPYQSTIDGNWDTPATWLNNTVQTLPNTTSIVNGSEITWNIVETNNHVNTTRDVTVLGLKVNTNELSVNADNSLVVSHYLLINGVVDLDGESQLIQTTGSDFDAASTGYLERDQQGEGNLYRYNDWSSPVYSGNDGKNYATVFDVLRDGTNPNSPGPITYVSGYNGSLSPLTLSTYWMYKYANLPDDSYSSWDHIGNTGAIYAGEGFLMKGTGAPGSPDQNYVFEGKPNNGTINLTIAAGNDYLVGNPYPSAIDAYQFIDDNPDITGPLYFWEHYGGDTHNLAGYQAGYATLTKSGGVLAAAHPSVSNLGSATKTPGRYVPVSQGFFVYSSTGGTIHFNNGQRIFVKEAVGTSVFMKTAKGKGSKTTKTKTPEIDTRSKFRIGFNAPKIDHRQLLLTIDKNTTDAVDWGYDGEIYEIFGDDMYWLIGDKKYVIQATNIISKEKEIPLGIQLSESGKITIKIDALENVDENTKLYIKDKLTGETYDITNQPFETNLEAGNYADRFVLAFQPKLLSIDEVTLNKGVKIYMNNSSSELNIEKIADINIQSIILYNYLGQVVNSWKSDINNRYMYLPVNTSTGVYIVQLNTLKGTITKKIIIE